MSVRLSDRLAWTNFGRGTPTAKWMLVPAGLAAVVMFALLPLRDGVLFASGTALVIAIMMRPFVGLMALAMAVPFAALFEVQVGGVTVSATDVIVGLVLAAWLATLLGRRERIVHFAWPLLAVVFFAALIAFDLTLQQSPAAGVKEVLRWAELLIVACVASNVVRSRRQIALLFATLLAAGSAEAAIGWYQFFARVGPASFALGPFLRAHGTFGQPNPFAGYLIMVWPLALSVVFGRVFLGPALSDQPPIPRQLHVAALAVASFVGMAVLFSLSRGAWLGLLAASLVLVSLFRRRLLAPLPAAAGLAAVLLLLYQLNLMPVTVEARVADALSHFRVFDVRSVELTSQNWAVVERMASWQAAWGMFEAQPLLGVGPGRFDEVYRDFAVGGWSKPLGHAHNYYLNILAEMGVVGLLSYLAVIASWLSCAIVWFRRALLGDVFLSTVLAGVIGALVAAAFHNLFDDLYVKGMNVHVGLLVGTLLAARGQLVGAGLDTGRSRGVYGRPT